MKNDDLRDQMLDLEPYPEDLKMKIREEIEYTKERPMKQWERVGMALVCVVLVVGATSKIVWAALHGDIGHDPLHYFVVLPAGVLLMGFALILFTKDLKRGTTRVRSEFLIVYGAVIYVLCVAVKNILLTGEFGIKDLAALVIAGLVGIYVRNEANTLSLRENVLRNELALAELAEQFGGRNEGDGI